MDVSPTEFWDDLEYMASADAMVSRCLKEGMADGANRRLSFLDFWERRLDASKKRSEVG